MQVPVTDVILNDQVSVVHCFSACYVCVHALSQLLCFYSGTPL